jgi:NhaP-type Na+/H+ or K+/H+ antiporter
MTALLLVFGATLTVAALLSARAERSVLSTAVLFMVVGFVIGPGIAGLLPSLPGHDLTMQVTRLALFAVLFTDGTGAHIPRNRASILLPARALLIGLPLTVGLNAVVCRWVAGMEWVPSWLVALCLGPTDPVLASAIVGRAAIPQRLRSLLNVESGVNDGLVFPALAALLAVGHGGSSGLGDLALRLAVGIAIGVVVALAIVKACGVRFLEVTDEYRPLLGFAAALVVFALSATVRANEYLAAFAAGLTLALTAGDLREPFARLNHMLAELLKLAALLLFGLLVDPRQFIELPLRGYAAALLILVLVRPAALALALARAGLDRREWLTVAWFGPKGFASVVYGLLVFHSGLPHAKAAAGLVGVVVTLSVIAHSSTDVPIARWFEREEGPKAERPAPHTDEGG